MGSGMYTKTFPGNANKIDWSSLDGVDQFMRDAWEAGASASRLAQLLSEKYDVKASRNAVIGRLTRAGITGKNGTSNHTGHRPSHRPKSQNPRTITKWPTPEAAPSNKVHAARIAAAPSTLKKIELAPLIAPDQLHHVAYADLGERECSWPISGSGATMLCCGGVQMVKPNGRRAPYCAFHMKAQGVKQ